MIPLVPNDHPLSGPPGKVSWQQPALPGATNWVVIWPCPVNLAAAQQLNDQANRISASEARAFQPLISGTTSSSRIVNPSRSTTWSSDLGCCTFLQGRDPGQVAFQQFLEGGGLASARETNTPLSISTSMARTHCSASARVSKVLDCSGWPFFRTCACH
jgi:hypothetical protein